MMSDKDLLKGIESLCVKYGAKRVLSGEEIPSACRAAGLIAVYDSKVQLHTLSNDHVVHVLDELADAELKAAEEFGLPVESIIYKDGEVCDIRYYNKKSAPAAAIPIK